MAKSKPHISIIVPIYNEAKNIRALYDALQGELSKLHITYEIIMVDDGSKDNSVEQLLAIQARNRKVHVLQLARNFGKEIALTAGINYSNGDAAIMMDSDLQHPPHYIQEFIEKWREGADVVIGIRAKNKREGIIKQIGSDLFYWGINRMSSTKLVPRSTDFRLIDKDVIDAFKRFTERNRITRGLIDWLGFDRTYIEFKAQPRLSGTPTYSHRKLLKLATDSFVSLSLMPLRVSGYLGVIIVSLSLPMGLYMYADKYVLGNRHSFTGSASVGVLVTFLVGLVLINLGLIALYIANIHAEVTNRPLYVLRHEPKKARHNG